MAFLIMPIVGDESLLFRVKEIEFINTSLFMSDTFGFMIGSSLWRLRY